AKVGLAQVLLGQVLLGQALLGQHGLQVGVVGVEIAKVARIRVLELRVSTEIRLAGVHGDQAATDLGAQPRTVFIRVPGNRTIWPRSLINHPILNGPWILVRDLAVLPLALGHLPAVTLRASPGFPLPGITPAHPPRLLIISRGPGHRSAPAHSGCLHHADGSGRAELAGPGVHTGPEPSPYTSGL